MNTDKYILLLESVILRKVTFGSTTLEIFSASELPQGQIGYSVDPEGNTLAGNGEGDWKENWIVIGYEDLCGDPLFVDLDLSHFPVFTAMHGLGDWNKQDVAESFTAFVKILDLVNDLSKGRNTMRMMEQNPISLEEKRLFLDEIKEITPTTSTEFWENLLVSN